MTQYRDARNRAISDEEIARTWIAAHPEEAAAIIRGKRPPAARPFQIHTKAAGDGKVQIERAGDPDEAA